jgi:hypothetical protein
MMPPKQQIGVREVVVRGVQPHMEQVEKCNQFVGSAMV